MERDPYALGAIENPFTSGTLLVTGGLLDPRLSLWSLDEAGLPTLADQITLVNGITDVKEHPITGTPYIAAQYANALYPVSIENGNAGDQAIAFGPIQPIAIPSDIRLGQPIYGFQVAFSPLGDLAFLSYRYPASIAMLDTSPGPSGSPVHTNLGFLEMGANPTGLEIVEGPDGETYLFASSSARKYMRFASLHLHWWVSSPLVVEREIWCHGTTGRLKPFACTFPSSKESGVAVVDIHPDSPFSSNILRLYGDLT